MVEPKQTSIIFDSNLKGILSRAALKKCQTRVARLFNTGGKTLPAAHQSLAFWRPTVPGGHSIVKNTGGWLDSLGSGILVGKDILGFYKNIDLDNS